MAEAALNMSLDDLIKKNKSAAGAGAGSSNKPRGRGRGGASGPGGASRRVPNRSFNRPAPYTTSKALDSPWNHDMFAAGDQAVGFSTQVAGVGSSFETGTKLYISNLDYGVTSEDLKELFSEVGSLKHYSVHYDRSGRSKGTAEVVFSRKQDAIAAVKRYNNVQLDGKPMKIEIVGTNIAAPVAPFVNGAFVDSRSGRGRGGSFGRSRAGRGRGGGGLRGGSRGRGRGGRGEKVVSADDLDADLMKYHSEAMQTN